MQLPNVTNRKKCMNMTLRVKNSKEMIGLVLSRKHREKESERNHL
jgi:hypothetical protein